LSPLKKAIFIKKIASLTLLFFVVSTPELQAARPESAIEREQKEYIERLAKEVKKTDRKKPSRALHQELQKVPLEAEPLLVEAASLGKMGRGKFDLEATVDFTVNYFRLNRSRRTLPDPKTFAEGSGMHRTIYSKDRYEEIISSLQERIRIVGFDPELATTIRIAIEFYEDQPLGLASFVINRFRIKPRLREIPEPEELADEFDITEIKAKRIYAKMIGQLVKKIETIGFDAKLKKRIESSLEQPPDEKEIKRKQKKKERKKEVKKEKPAAPPYELEDGLIYSVIIFEKKDRRKFPSPHELLKDTDLGAEFLKNNYQKMLEVMPQWVDTFDIHKTNEVDPAEIRARIKRAVAMKVRLEETVAEYIIEQFIENTELSKIPIEKIAAYFGYSGQTIRNNLPGEEGILTVLDQKIETQEFSKELKDRLLIRRGVLPAFLF